MSQTLDNLARRESASQKGSNSGASLALLRSLERALYAVRTESGVVLSEVPPAASHQLAGMIPSVKPEELGSVAFCEAHSLKYPYLAGAMANGIASAELVIAMGKAGFMGFFGSGGLPISRIEQAILRIQEQLTFEPYGFNLLHNPFEPKVEMETVELYLKHQIRRVEAAAFMEVTPAVVLFRAKGMRALPDGRVIAPNNIFAKISRPEVAGRFMAPPPESILRELVASKKLKEEEARLAAKLPVAQAITAEADSGGHTDQRPLPVLIPIILDERAKAMEKYNYYQHGITIHVGAAGGIGEPHAANAAFAMGADYIVTGSVNQASTQGGTSDLVKQMLVEADMADVVMAPASDMFEIGAKVQVLKRGTLYAQRAQKLFELYRLYPDFESVPAAEREKVEKQILQRPFAEVWAETEKYWDTRDPAKAEKGRKNGKERMALCFRWYLGLSSRWAAAGEAGRRYDYQIWCGAALGAYNRWVKGTALEPRENRDAPTIAKAILAGAAVLTRYQAAKRAGVDSLPSLHEVTKPAQA